MSNVDIELGQNETPKSRNESEADRVEKSIRRWIYKNSTIAKTHCSLMIGTPGLGKSFVMSKLKNLEGYNFKILKPTDIFSSWQGESGKNIEKIFHEASEQGPTILVIDELDGLIGKRTDSHQSEVSRQVKDLILTLTAGVESLPGIFVVGATNHPELIDTAYLDRCTKIIKMNLPTQTDKYTFFQSYMTEHGYDHTITEPEFLSLNTNLYSYRNLESLLGAALEDGPFKRAEDSKHFKVIEGDDNDLFEGCSCEDEDCEQLQKNYFNIPRENLKLSPLTINDLAEATKTVAPSATAQDVENINYFHKHKKMPLINQDALPSPPGYRSQSGCGSATLLIGIAMILLIIFVLILFLQMSCNCLHNIFDE